MTTRLYIGLLLVASLLMVLFATIGTTKEEVAPQPAPFLMVDDTWADSVWRHLGQEEKIAEMFMVVADYSDSTSLDLADLVIRNKVGGLLFRGYPVAEQYQLTQAIRQDRDHPLLVAMDAMGDDPNLIQLPRDLSFAAIQDQALLQEIGELSASQMKALGVQLYISSALQTGFRMSETSGTIPNLSALNRGFQQENVLLCPSEAVPYFPYERDSARVREQLEPYHQMSQSGFAAMMIDPEVIDRIHLNSQKQQIIRTYLESRIDYKGLLLGEVQDSFGDTENQVRKMLKAGIDVIMVRPHQLEEAMATARDLVHRNFLAESDVKESAHKMLLAKTWSHAIEEEMIVSADSIDPAIDIAVSAWGNRLLTQASLTLVQNQEQQIPFTQMKERAPHLLVIGEALPALLNRMRTYGPVSTSQIRVEQDQPLASLNPELLDEFDPVVIALHGTTPNRQRDTDFFASLAEVQARTPVIILNFGELEVLRDLESLPNLVQVYDNSVLDQELAAQLLWGGIEPRGQVPLDLSDRLYAGKGERFAPTRLAFSMPEEVGLKTASLMQIDSIVEEGIHAYAMPGCQVLVARKGKVIYNKSFGHHTYARKRRVYPTDLYDLASVTKVAATTMAMMQMDQDGRLNPNDNLGRFFQDKMVTVDSVIRLDSVFVHRDSFPKSKEASPFVFAAQRSATRGESIIDTINWNEDSVLLVRTWKRGRYQKRGEIFDLKLSELLTHSSGLPAGLPILPYIAYRDSLTGKYDRFFQPSEDSMYSVQVAGDFFLRKDYRDSLWAATKATHYAPAKEYEYSDANMILIQQAIDSLNQEPIDTFLQRKVYERLGMQNTSFNPRLWCEPERIVPTTYDGGWRGQLLRGYVHDPTAALLGGVSGNAGLFSNAQDLAHLFQMLLNEGEYGGERFLDRKLVREYTRRQQGHRGYGFDKPPSKRTSYIIGSEASLDSYGHTGFTGTCVWVDPKEELVYIFLSNRVHPKANNWKLNELEIRQRIHDVVYAAIAPIQQT